MAEGSVDAVQLPVFTHATKYIICCPADTLLPILTVEEMMLYTAELKRPRTEPLASKKAAVRELLEKLALTQCR
jgi:ABC-type multidrug transport system ATPase subunit